MSDTHEAGAYAKLLDMEGTRIPKYYGSYTLHLPVVLENPQTEARKTTATRLIRLVLIDLVPGITVSSIKSPKETFSQADRQYIVKALVDFDSDLYARDMIHDDFYPRNVIITTTAKDGDGCREQRQKKQQQRKT